MTGSASAISTILTHTTVMEKISGISGRSYPSIHPTKVRWNRNRLAQHTKSHFENPPVCSSSYFPCCHLKYLKCSKVQQEEKAERYLFPEPSKPAFFFRRCIYRIVMQVIMNLSKCHWCGTPARLPAESKTWENTPSIPLSIRPHSILIDTQPWISSWAF